MIIDDSGRGAPHTARTRRLLTTVAAALAGCLLATACSTSVAGLPTLPGQVGSVGSSAGDGSTPASPSAGDAVPAGVGTVEPYVVKGRVTTEAGEPLAGVSVLADNTLAYGSNAPAVTGADGSYRIELPRSDVYVWRMWGQIEVTFHGEHFSLDLDVDQTPFGSSEGAIRDFTWKLTGLKDADLELYYGGRVYVYEDLNSDDLYDKQWQISFTPQGALIDGSTVEPFTKPVTDGEIDDVPVGEYTVTASYLPDGGGDPIPLLIRSRDDGEYASSATAGFHDDSGPLMQLEIAMP